MTHAVATGSGSGTVTTVVQGRRRRAARRRTVVALLSIALVAVFALSLMAGRTFYPASDVLDVVLGQDVPGASYTVGRLRLPRAVLAVAAGLCFGIAGVTFQTMLRNPLASPDVIGISAGAGAAATFAIVTLSWTSTQVSAFAIVSGLAVALVIYVLSFEDGVVGTRLILIGIGIAAVLESATAYILSRAAEWDLQEATRWLTGSLNGSSWDAAVPVLLAAVILTPVLMLLDRDLAITRLGDDMAPALGVRVSRTRLLAIVAATGLIAFATAATGPIAFVAFLSGPIAARIVGPGASLLVPSALVGALLVLVADFCGQYAFDTRYPVGIVTGVLGAPYLVYLIARSHRGGGSL
ncbi:iron ABC transporter permease [Rhodococcus sp. BP-349]|uniref:FecCD family ABC transporter permease n=1 Tax=unclassified Rhodococcus (in: high G+C Gram-positive bacteria) TaxID=192944 RepID=UPI001D23741D|nr:MULTISPECIES: iron chelate uptake ABC transporter family permease subunit [unclassified Rhodococcus (in: high G+C Gram-positive bacteria)]MBY6538464.1 iron ABC transporter permease [Rhodococcus sp. BP-363]MBY6542801.1 iron ABC transporter permease [Rhodococcus sp. BP-369]MBY6562031.1 iron ABC transporter permease [Rhodococcus sp. BP-370]MBY6576323.1 iron ABC transporter permease [Rhodococcus sp. BP-364]MBY6585624.1 iron ABC transporter permease [Rhodococcus sp. BP-358]